MPQFKSFVCIVTIIVLLINNGAIVHVISDVWLTSPS